jgi:type I restriction enzyme S subunit
MKWGCGMNEVLPLGWALSTIEDCVNKLGLFTDGDWIEKKDQDINGRIRLLQLADVGDGKFIDKSSKYINENTFKKLNCTEVFPGDILLARMPQPLGRACILPSINYRAITAVDVCIIRPCQTFINPIWLHYFINAAQFRNRISELSSGTTRKRISRKNLGSISLFLPPLNEQKRIVAKLDKIIPRIDKVKERLDKIPVIIKRFRQSVLTAAVTGKLTEEWREENHISFEWENKRLESIIKKGPQNGIYKSQKFYGKGSLILRIDNFYNGKINPWNTLKRLTVTNKELSLYGLSNDDIVINRVNSMTFLGKSALVQDLKEPCVFESNMMRIEIDKSCVNIEFLIRFLNCQLGLQELRKNAKHAVNQSSINQQDVKAVIVPLPPLKEQKEIVRQVDNLFALADKLETHYQKAKAKVDKLSQSVLAKAFRGELVPQDPNDEPAEKLLERIMKEKAKMEAELKKTKKKKSRKKCD